MNREQFEAQWPNIKAYVQDKWSRLTDEDIRQINGRFDQFLSKVQQRYGYTREEIEEQIRSWKPSVKGSVDREEAVSRGSRSDRSDRTEGSNLGKWLLAAGIPFLFLLGYLGTQNTMHDNTRTTPRTSDQPLYTTVPSDTQVDRVVIQDARRALVANGFSIRDLDNITITSADGVVTIRGTVANEQQKTLIIRALEKLNGVKKVDSSGLEIRS